MLSGFALGPLFAAVAVALLGYRNTFIAAGILMYSGSIVSALFIREERVRYVKPEKGTGALGLALRTPVVWSALVVVLTLSYAAAMVQPVLPPFVATLLPEGSSTTAVVGWLYFGISTASAIAAVLAGRLIRRLGLQRVLLFCVIGVAAFLLPAGLATNVGVLAVLVIAMSLFQGALQTSTVSLLPDVVSAAAVSSVFGLYQSVSALSQQLGPALGGGLAAAVGFRTVFPVAGAALLVLGLPALYVFRRLARAHHAAVAAAEETAGTAAHALLPET